MHMKPVRLLYPFREIKSKIDVDAICVKLEK